LGYQQEAVAEGEERANGVWPNAADCMRQSLGEMAYETWITPLKLIELRGQTAIVEAPNRFFRDCIGERYRELVQRYGQPHSQALANSSDVITLLSLHAQLD